jgi:O2-independent ubiquinone biosynthesis protein UbiU
LIAINSYPAAGNMDPWRKAVDDAAALGADAAILADIGLMAYAAEKHPGLRLHLSVQASACNAEAVALYVKAFGVRRVVLPRVLSVADIAGLTAAAAVEIEVFVFGGLCPMAEGRCTLSSYATGRSPNRQGVCSPAEAVRYEQRGTDTVSRLGDYTINIFAEGEPAGYPTLCKGRFQAHDKASYLFEEPTSLNAIDLLPQLSAAGVTALKIEGRQRGKAYIAEVVRTYRAALDDFERTGRVSSAALSWAMEGGKETTGAYKRDWR